MSNDISQVDSLRIRAIEEPQEGLSNLGHVSYRRNDYERTPATDTVNFKGEEKENKNTGGIVALGVAALTIGSAIYAGLHGKNILKKAGKETGLVENIKTGYKNFLKKAENTDIVKATQINEGILVKEELTDIQLIDFNPENKKFLDKIQTKFKAEWEQLKNLEDGRYVKKDGKYVPATESDMNYVEVKHFSEGLSRNIIEHYKNGKLKRFITINDKDVLKSYEMNDGRIVARCMNGEACVSTNLKKSHNSLAFDLAERYGEMYKYHLAK